MNKHTVKGCVSSDGQEQCPFLGYDATARKSPECDYCACPGADYKEINLYGTDKDGEPCLTEGRPGWCPLPIVIEHGKCEDLPKVGKNR